MTLKTLEKSKISIMIPLLSSDLVIYFFRACFLNFEVNFQIFSPWVFSYRLNRVINGTYRPPVSSVPIRRVSNGKGYGCKFRDFPHLNYQFTWAKVESLLKEQKQGFPSTFWIFAWHVTDEKSSSDDIPFNSSVVSLGKPKSECPALPISFYWRWVSIL